MNVHMIVYYYRQLVSQVNTQNHIFRVFGEKDRENLQQTDVHDHLAESGEKKLQLFCLSQQEILEKLGLEKRADLLDNMNVHMIVLMIDNTYTRIW